MSVMSILQVSGISFHSQNQNSTTFLLSHAPSQKVLTDNFPCIIFLFGKFPSLMKVIYYGHDLNFSETTGSCHCHCH